MNRAQTVQTINDVLQRRGDRTIASLENELKQIGGEAHAEEVAAFCTDIDAYLDQKYLLRKSYEKSGNKEYQYKIFDPDAERPLKIVNQQLFDRAAKAGFPSGFFRESYFDGVTFYCLPDYTTFRHSRFNNCTFAVCRVMHATLEEVSIYSSEFHSCPLENVSFYKSTLANTHFYDCGLQDVSFHDARLKSCNTMDCTMGSVNYLNATLDGCSFGRTDSYDIRNLHTATITMGGATDEEVNHNRMAVYAALRPESRDRQPLPHKKRGTR